MSPCCHQVRHRRKGVAAFHQRLADEHHIGAGLGVFEDVMWATDPGLGDAYDVVGHQRSQLGEGAAIDFKGPQIAGVDADQRRSGVDGPAHLVSRMHLDKWGQPYRERAFDQQDQLVVVERSSDQQHQVCSCRPRLP